MNKKDIVSFIRRNEKYFVLFLVAAGAFLRIFAIGAFPAGLNQDEASAGYEAWSILTCGHDRNGVILPVLFISWGSGQNVLYSYLSIPFIAIFGLNEFSLRLVAAIAGSISLPLFYGLAKKIRGGLFGLVALAILAVNPWHIMISRWALESNLFPFTLLLGTFFLVKSFEKPWRLAAAAAVFALSLYAYGTAFIFLPLFFIAVIIYMIKNELVKTRCFLVSALIFIVIALPITLCNAINVLGIGDIKLLGFTLPSLTEARQASTTVFGGGSIITNIKNLFMILLTQSDGLSWNSIPTWGLFWGIPGLLFIIAGVVISLVKIRTSKHEPIILFALLASIISAALIEVNINRINMIFLPLIYFQAYGIYFCLRLVGKRFILPVIVCFAAACALFCRSYFGSYQDTMSQCFFYGLGEAIEYADEMDTQKVWITDAVNEPYIYVLFYEQIPYSEFNDTVLYEDEEAPFRHVLSFDKYIFGGKAPSSDAALIMTTSQAQESEFLEIAAEFGNFSVVILE